MPVGCEGSGPVRVSPYSQTVRPSGIGTETDRSAAPHWVLGSVARAAVNAAGVFGARFAQRAIAGAARAMLWAVVAELGELEIVDGGAADEGGTDASGPDVVGSADDESANGDSADERALVKVARSAHTAISRSMPRAAKGVRRSGR